MIYILRISKDNIIKRRLDLLNGLFYSIQRGISEFFHNVLILPIIAFIIVLRNVSLGEISGKLLILQHNTTTVLGEEKFNKMKGWPCVIPL